MQILEAVFLNLKILNIYKIALQVFLKISVVCFLEDQVTL